jgi:hypothetical protein
VIPSIIDRIKERIPLIIQNCKTRLENPRPPTSVLTPSSISDHNLKTRNTEGEYSTTSAESSSFQDVSLDTLNDMEIASWDHSDDLFSDLNATAEPNLDLTFCTSDLPTIPPCSDAHPHYDSRDRSRLDPACPHPEEQRNFGDNVPFADLTQHQQDRSYLDAFL